MPQGREIFGRLTVEENLRLALVVHGRAGADAKAVLPDGTTVIQAALLMKNYGYTNVRGIYERRNALNIETSAVRVMETLDGEVVRVG